MKRHAATFYLALVLLLTGLLIQPSSGRALSSGQKGQIILYSYGPARVQVTGPDGSRAGAELVGGGELEEIEGSDVMVERSSDRSDGWTITLKNPVPGVYRINVLGTGTGGVVMDLEALDSSGRGRSSHVFKRVKEGDSLEYVLDYSPDPKSDNQLKETAN